MFIIKRVFNGWRNKTMIKCTNAVYPNGMLADSRYNLFMSYAEAKEAFDKL